MIGAIPAPPTFTQIAGEVYVDMAKNDTSLPKIVEILCMSTPTDPMFGYGDIVSVYAGTELLGKYDGSACPNGFKVLGKSELWQYDPRQIIRNANIDGAIYPHIVMWDSTYGKLACGEYRGKIIQHIKYGKCILIRDGAALPSIIPRRKYNWLFQMKEIFIHPSNKDTLAGDPIDWRGSSGCVTVRKSQYADFIDNFKLGETVIIIIRQDGNGR